MPEKHSHCSYCGAPFPEGVSWPRTCPSCGQTSYLNPLPVSVLLQPVGESGVLTVRRAIPPHEGVLALPGGFIDIGESWQAAAARELEEEADIEIAPEGVEVFEVMSAPDGTVLIFGVAPALDPDELGSFEPTTEASERVIVEEPRELAFPLHTAALRAYFEESD